MNNDIVKPPQETPKPKVVDGIVPNPQPAKTESNLPPQENPEAPAEDGAKSQQENKAPDQPPKKPKKKPLKLPVFLALIVLSGLAGLAIYIGFFADEMAKKESKSEGTTSQSADNSVEQNKQEASDIVNLINDLQDDTDTSGDGLTDQNLGL